MVVLHLGGNNDLKLTERKTRRIKTVKNLSAALKEVETRMLLLRVPKFKNISNREIDKAIKSVTSAIMEPIEAATTEKDIRDDHIVLTPEIGERMKRRRDAVKQKKKASNSTAWVEFLKEIIKEETDMIRNGIDQLRNKKLKEKLESIKPGPGMIGKIKKFPNAQRKLEKIVVDGEREIAKEFFQFYKELYAKIIPPHPEADKYEQRYPEADFNPSIEKKYQRDPDYRLLAAFRSGVFCKGEVGWLAGVCRSCEMELENTEHLIECGRDSENRPWRVLTCEDGGGRDWMRRVARM